MPQTWTNWSREQRCAPVAIERPASEEQLAATVAAAARRGQTVKAVGSGHSFTDCACSEGVLVDLTAMRRVLAADAQSGLVTVEGGITLHELGPQLAAHGLALENQGDIDAQTMAGATATATHGTGVTFPNISAQIVALRLVTASGDVLSISRESDPDAFLAARVSVGALGVVSAITLQAIPLYTLDRRDKPRPLEETLDRLDELVDGYDHFEFFVFPYTRTALTRTSMRSAEPPATRPSWKRGVQEDLLENGVLELICRTGRAFPSAVPRLNQRMAGLLSGGRLVDHAYRVYATKRRVRFTEMEYAIPRAYAREAIERVIDLVERRRLPITFPLEVRFAAGDDAFLSTAHERETAYVAVHQFNGMAFEEYFRAVEAIMDGLGGRPHWGKRHFQSAATLRERYPQWDRFQAVRERLDPAGVFANDYTRRVLG